MQGVIIVTSWLGGNYFEWGQLQFGVKGHPIFSNQSWCISLVPDVTWA